MLCNVSRGIPLTSHTRIDKSLYTHSLRGRVHTKKKQVIREIFHGTVDSLLTSTSVFTEYLSLTS